MGYHPPASRTHTALLVFFLETPNLTKRKLRYYNTDIENGLEHTSYGGVFQSNFCFEVNDKPCVPCQGSTDIGQ